MIANVTAARRVLVVTGTRADWGLLRGTVRLLRDDQSIALQVLATAAHLSPAHGNTVSDIRAEGIDPLLLETLVSSDSFAGTAKSIGLGVLGATDVLMRERPDIVLLMGDRFETLAVAVAANAMRVPIAHVHGGEVTSGAQDEAWRHAITKLAHVHFVTTEGAGRRVAQLGEARWRIHVVGAPGLDVLRETRPLNEAELAGELGAAISHPLIVVTYHPATLDALPPEAQVNEVIAALDGLEATIVVTAPNADAGGHVVRECLARFAAASRQRHFVTSLGNDLYPALLGHCDVMVGNSSSGIIEAAHFELPVVNVGSRQDGRERTANVIDVACERSAIAGAIARALDSSFRRSLRGLRNPYGDGHASGRIARVLREVELGQRLLRKEFVDQ